MLIIRLARFCLYHMLSFNLASCRSLEFRLKSYSNAEERIYECYMHVWHTCTCSCNILLGSISQEMCRKFLVHIKYLKFWTLELYSLLSDWYILKLWKVIFKRNDLWNFICSLPKKSYLNSWFENLRIHFE